MFKEVLNNKWISSNGKWKVSTEVRESNQVIISMINVFSSVREGVWKDESTNDKLPKYVATELQKARDLVEKVKREDLLALAEMTVTTID